MLSLLTWRTYPGRYFKSQNWAQTCSKDFTSKILEIVDARCWEVHSVLRKGSIEINRSPCIIVLVLKC